MTSASDIQKMREVVKKNASQFPKQWAERVDKMPDAQVTAIYIRLRTKANSKEN